MSSMKTVLKEMSDGFASKLIGLLKAATVEELIALQGEGKSRLKPVPKPGKKRGRKPGRKPGRNPGRKPSRPPMVKRVRPAKAKVGRPTKKFESVKKQIAKFAKKVAKKTRAKKVQPAADVQLS